MAPFVKINPKTVRLSPRRTELFSAPVAAKTATFVLPLADPDPPLAHDGLHALVVPHKFVLLFQV